MLPQHHHWQLLQLNRGDLLQVLLLQGSTRASKQ
jgi:hypothetical protein